MLPPSPPSPPEGPPFGTNFSRRNATAPLPPSPALTRTTTSSTNCMVPPTGRPEAALRRYDFAGDDRDYRALAGLGELHLAALEREEGVVLAHADVAARVDRRADLAHEDVAGEHELAVVALDAPALAVR